MVEGNKTIKEIPGSRYNIKQLFSVNPEELKVAGAEAVAVSETELRRISFLQNPKDSVAVCEVIEPKMLTDVPVQLVLDGIQDPGNLGTIIRLADWFGIEQVICSEDTADYYNPKVIQASMGSFLRVNIIYTDLHTYFASSDRKVIGTDMDGENMYGFAFPEEFDLVLGNEGNGIRPETEAILTYKITIPRAGKSRATESLNVSMAAGIILGQIYSKA